MRTYQHKTLQGQHLLKNDKFSDTWQPFQGEFCKLPCTAIIPSQSLLSGDEQTTLEGVRLVREDPFVIFTAVSGVAWTVMV